MKKINYISRSRFLTAIGLVLLVGATGLLMFTKNFFETSGETQGEVIKILEITSEDNGKTFYKPLVQFETFDNEDVEFSPNFTTGSPRYNTGDTVPVIYDPNNPENASIKSFWDIWLNMILMGGAAIILFVAGIVSTKYFRGEQQHGESLKGAGKLVEAKFIKVEEHGIGTNEGIYYTVLYEWNDGRKTHKFTSGKYRLDPEKFKPIDKMPVYVNPEDPKDYYMDVEELERLNEE